MLDLYATLGIDRSADHATVRRAYRRAAKSAHPDHGGTVKQFSLVTLAHDTLTDDKRRAHYDATGEIEDKPVDNRRSEVMQILFRALDTAMQQVISANRKLTEEDMVRRTKESLRQYRAQSAKERSEFERNRERTSLLLGRFVTEGDNVMEAILKGRISACDGEIAKRDLQVSLLDEALAMLDGYTFRADEPEKRQDGPTTINMGQIWGFRFG